MQQLNQQYTVYLFTDIYCIKNILQNVQINSTVYTAKVIRAYSDNDDGISIRYSLAKVGRSYQDFFIDSYSGNIHIRSLPDRESRSEYSVSKNTVHYFYLCRCVQIKGLRVQ